MLRSRFAAVVVVLLSPLLMAQNCSVEPPSPSYSSVAGTWTGYVYLPNYKPVEIYLDVFNNGRINGSIKFTDTGFVHTIKEGRASGQSMWIEIHPWVNTYRISGIANDEFTSFIECSVHRWDGSQGWNYVGGCRLHRAG